jgi:hypothetical protein
MHADMILFYLGLGRMFSEGFLFRSLCRFAQLRPVPRSKQGKRKSKASIKIVRHIYNIKYKYIIYLLNSHISSPMTGNAPQESSICLEKFLMSN